MSFCACSGVLRATCLPCRTRAICSTQCAVCSSNIQSLGHVRPITSMLANCFHSSVPFYPFLITHAPFSYLYIHCSLSSPMTKVKRVTLSPSQTRTLSKALITPCWRKKVCSHSIQNSHCLDPHTHALMAHPRSKKHALTPTPTRLSSATILTRLLYQ